MASVAPTQAVLDGGRSDRRPRSWLSEPLLHFVVLGGLLFALDHFLVTRADDPHTIVVSADVNKELVDIFAGARNRPPTPMSTPVPRPRKARHEPQNEPCASPSFGTARPLRARFVLAERD